MNGDRVSSKSIDVFDVPSPGIEMISIGEGGSDWVDVGGGGGARWVERSVSDSRWLIGTSGADIW